MNSKTGICDEADSRFDSNGNIVKSVVFEGVGGVL
jgi:hypothetical protein